jgi:hypothetical protein
MPLALGAKVSGRTQNRAVLKAIISASAKDPSSLPRLVLTRSAEGDVVACSRAAKSSFLTANSVRRPRGERSRRYRCVR